MDLQRLLLGVLLVTVSVAQAQTMYRYVDKAGRVGYTDQAPPPDARQVEEVRPRQTGVVEAGQSFALKKAQQEFPVTVILGAECDDFCNDAKALLARRGVPFTESVIRTEEDVANYRKQFGTQEVSVPTLVVGTQKQIGLEEGAWNRMLDDAGYPRAVVTGPATQGAAPPRPAAPGPIR